MANQLASLVAEGDRALQAGEWPAARQAFEAAVDLNASGADDASGEAVGHPAAAAAEALRGLAEALWWLGELDEAVVRWEQAYAAFRRRPDPAQAVQVALRLCFDYRAHVGNAAAAAGWRRRAARLVDDFSLDELRGWLAFITAYDTENPEDSERAAREALQRARASADLDLQLCALSQIGASLVAQGHVEKGVAFLDEALAGSLGGESDSLNTVVFTSCNMITSCSQSADFERATQWIRAADRFTQRYGCPFLYVECRTFYGGVLVATGEWRRAEGELRTAIEQSKGCAPVLHRQALATLAELRLDQGRLEEAERLVTGLDDHGPGATVLARINLRRGNPAVAAAIARRRLDLLGERRVESAELEELLGEAEVALGEHDTAADRGRRLAQLGTTRSCGVVVARGERLAGRAMAARGEARVAHAHLDMALSSFLTLEMPLEAARTRALLAEALRHDQQEVAVAEARTALTAFEHLGADTDADEAAALLRQLGVKAARAGPKEMGALTRREREVLGLLGEGLSNPDIASRLHLSRKTVEHHVANVLAKLGLHSRAQAAAEAVRRADSAAK